MYEHTCAYRLTDEMRMMLGFVRWLSEAKAFAMQVCRPKSEPWYPCTNGREPALPSFLLTSIHALWHSYAQHLMILLMLMMMIEFKILRD